MTICEQIDHMLRNLGPNIVALRKRNYLSQEDLSKKTGISRVCLSRYERGKMWASDDHIAKLCGFFKLSRQELLEKEWKIVGTFGE